MKVLHIISSGGLFGAEGVVLSLCEQLIKQNIETSLINISSVPEKTSDIIAKAEEMNIPAFDLTCNGRFDWQTIKKLSQFLKDKKIDILHCHGYKADIFGFFASRGLNVKLISTNHNWTSDTFAVKIYESIDSLCLNFFDKIVGVSDKITNKLKKNIFLKNKTSTIFNGINLSQFQPSLDQDIKAFKKEFNIPEDGIVIGSIGRVVKDKDFSSLLRSAKQVCSDFENAYFLIVGDGPLMSELKSLAKELEIEDKVIFTGIQTDMNLIYDMLDIFVISSVNEGLPLVLLEAMINEKPIVTTDVGAIKNVINDQENGLMIPSKNYPALTHAIIDLLKDKHKAKKLSLEAKKTVSEKFSAEIMAKQYVAVFKELIEKK